MTSLISARRAAEQFARVVDGSGADVADRYADLTATVDVLRRHDGPVARPEFVADLRSQLMAAADTQLVRSDRPRSSDLAPVVNLRPSRHPRRLAVAAAAFVVVGGTAGMAAAAERALPGSALYPIKRGIESAQVSLNTSDAAKGRDLVGQAGTRLEEVAQLVGNDDSSSQITHTLASYQRTLAHGSDLLFVAYQRDPSSEDLSQLRGMLQTQTDQLKTLAGQAPSETRGDFASASGLLADLDQQARVLCSNCGPDTGASDGGDLSSSPALESLLSEPADAAAAQAQEQAQKLLAKQAGQIASTTPKTTTPTPSGTTTQTRDGSSTSTPGVTLPSIPTQTGSLTGTVTTVTGTVQGLVNEVGTSTGGLLAPVTTTVNNTLDPLTGLLLGK
jgi:hypothetical protein